MRLKRIVRLSILISVLSSNPFTSCFGNFMKESETSLGILYEAPNSEILAFPAKPHSVFDVVKEIDLGGHTYRMPEDVTLRHEGGVIKNGTLIGNKTKIIAKKDLFNRVYIRGSWSVENISTNLFADLSYHNSLKDVLALSNPEIKNRVVIEKGDYVLQVKSKKSVGITVPSNTTLIIDGTIRLLPNNLDYYEIVSAKGQNITISGTGCIIGDKEKHSGTKGEWGMGIFVRGNNINVRGITVKDCWGDCIYVGSDSRNVHIEKCILDNGRRQGISVTSARNVYIYDCVIKNVHGTAPQRAIDIEPNKGDTVQNVYIHNIRIQNCFGGILAYGAAKSAYVSDIYIDNCFVDEKVKASSYSFSYTNKVSLKNCTAENGERNINFNHVNIVETKKNKVNGRSNMETYKSCKFVNGKKQ